MNPPNTYKVLVRHLGYWGQELGRGEYYYRWYWQADLRSWFMHNFWGFDCNTYVHNDMRDKVKARPVVFK